jgi:hypothetical protein
MVTMHFELKTWLRVFSNLIVIALLNCFWLHLNLQIKTAYKVFLFYQEHISHLDVALLNIYI